MHPLIYAGYTSLKINTTLYYHCEELLMKGVLECE